MDSTASEDAPLIYVAGEPRPTGAYLLRIRIRITCDVSFGRYRRGQAVRLPAGDYLYIGSALGQQGASTLPRRLLRHARRSGRRQPHAIHTDLHELFLTLGWVHAEKQAARPKQLRWHVDYLLDRPEAEIAQVYLYCSPRRVEAELARCLAADSTTQIAAPGLGASDSPGQTHLLRACGDEGWWRSLAQIAFD